MTSTELIRKYNVAGPRYTSYPTVPYWDSATMNNKVWEESLQKNWTAMQEEGIAIYIHLPFCESMCTFCGCHKRITKRHNQEIPYIETLLKEWDLYVQLFPELPKIREIHLGGGTPTFFSPDNLKILISRLLEKAEILEDFEFSFEGHPNNTSFEHLKTLYEVGFRRVSYGVQDYSPTVQKAINRIQPFFTVQQVHEWSKEIGYTSVNHDLVFGLPHQTLESMVDTIEKTNQLKPERIAFYSYAHVPWIKGVGQRGFDENDLPKDEEKRALYELGKQMLYDQGYIEIGMDHFALPSDSLYKAVQNKTLHRNFMGYTAGHSKAVIGLGISSISDSWFAFAQNEKDLNDYQKRVEEGVIPIFRGHLLTDEDLIIRQHILDLMCRFETTFNGDPDLFSMICEDLQEPLSDGLVEVNEQTIKLKKPGYPFIRNIAMAFDIRLKERKPQTRLFSKTV